MADGIFPSLMTALTNWLGWRSNAKNEDRRISQEQHILAAQLAPELDRYAAICLDVSHDDGTEEGWPAGHDRLYHQVTVPAPLFDPQPKQAELKVLPPELMHDILAFPSEAAELNRTLEGAAFFDPPDFRAFFQTRQLGYVELGLKAVALARRLRDLVGVKPPAPIAGMLPIEGLLQERQEQLEREENARNKRWAARELPFAQGTSND